VAIVRHNSVANRKITSVAIPALGTGVGGMPAAEAAAQMRAAYANVIEEQWRRDLARECLASQRGWWPWPCGSAALARPFDA